MLQAAAPALVLASGSAARALVLGAAGLRFRQVSPDLDEAAIKREARAAGLGAAETALRLARAKAGAVAADGALVLGADQILVCDGDWFDKPASRAAARAHLLRLRGRRHRLVTAAVALRDGAVLWEHVAEPVLGMRDFSPDFLDAYLAMEGDAVLGSVGAYRLEGAGIQLFDFVEGDIASILGLPLLPLLAFLRASGMLLA